AKRLSSEAPHHHADCNESVAIAFERKWHSLQFRFGTAHEAHQRMRRSNAGAGGLERSERLGSQGSAGMNCDLTRPIATRRDLAGNIKNGVIGDAYPSCLSIELSLEESAHTRVHSLRELARTGNRLCIVSSNDLDHTMPAASQCHSQRCCQSSG